MCRSCGSWVLISAGMRLGSKRRSRAESEVVEELIVEWVTLSLGLFILTCYVF